MRRPLRLRTAVESDVPYIVHFGLAFCVMLAVILTVAWVFRQFSGGRPNRGSEHTTRRVGIVDVVRLNAARMLVLFRRDDVEHLLMIGDPTDIIVGADIGVPGPAALNIRARTAAVTPPKPALPIRAPSILASPVGSTVSRPLRERLAALADEITRSEGVTIDRHSPTS